MKPYLPGETKEEHKKRLNRESRKKLYHNKKLLGKLKKKKEKTEFILKAF